MIVRAFTLSKFRKFQFDENKFFVSMSVCKSRLPKTKIIQIGLYLLENFPHFPKQTQCTNLKLRGLTELITIYYFSIEKGVLKYFTKFTGKHLCQSLFFNKVVETLAQVFSCRFCEIFKNTSFTEHLRATALILFVESFQFTNTIFLK